MIMPLCYTCRYTFEKVQVHIQVRDSRLSVQHFLREEFFCPRRSRFPLCYAFEMRKRVSRVVIRNVRPQVECGRFPIKRVMGNAVDVEADIFADGHDLISCVVQYRRNGVSEWSESSMTALGNDHWCATFMVEEAGLYLYRLMAWVNPVSTWHHDMLKRIEAKQDVAVDLLIGSNLLKAAAARATSEDAGKLLAAAEDLSPEKLTEDLVRIAAAWADRSEAATSSDLQVTVDRVRAEFSTWYEVFPRSCATEPGVHGTFRDAERRLPEIANMGFDVLYFPPIHPIGRTNRKGRNNEPAAGPDEPGSPWAIGSSEGGHKAIHPSLGTLEDFRRLIAAAGKLGIEIALDLAYQCSPDHPYLKEHPGWFRLRPDGTMQYAENPPKKYQDIYPFDFDTTDREGLWTELKSIVEFWIEEGVRIFRVDNPHTKPFAFWEWMIGDLKARHPDLIFLSEAFTRPNIMYWLAKLGFTQSYTYFTWRNTKPEITEYLTELTATGVREFFRPNLWPNTPDILHAYLQQGGRPAFMARLVLAATLSGNYGIYGGAYELCENVPREQGSEEYLNSEKYEIRFRDVNDPRSIRWFIERVNGIRRTNSELQRNSGLHFHRIENDQIIAYSKGRILMIVNLDPHQIQSGFIELDLNKLGIDGRHPYVATDLLSGMRYKWQGPRNYVELRPSEMPAHILKLE
jgi:starch synthase (maltosyl-transferring)